MAIISVICPWCRTRLRAADTMIGREAQCPQCSRMLPVKRATAEELAATPLTPRAAESTGYDLAPSRPGPPIETPESEPTAAAERVVPLVLEREESGPRVYGSVRGQFLTAKHLLGVVVLLLLVGGLVAWILFRPQPARVAVVRAVPVERFTALNSVASIAPPAEGGQITYTVGGKESIVIVRPADDADWLLVELDMPREVLLRRVAAGPRGTVVRADQFTIEGGKLPAKGGLILVRELNPGATLDLAAADTHSGWQALPPDVRHDEESQVTADGGVVSYAGGGEGSVKAMGKVEMGPGDTGVTATGSVAVTTAGGAAVQFNYAGDLLNVTWDAAASGHYAVREHTLVRPALLPARVRLTLLAPRPQRHLATQLTVRLGDEEVATLEAAVASPASKPEH